MKTKKILLPFLALNLALVSPAHLRAQETQSAAPSKSLSSSIVTASEKLWSEFTAALKNAKLRKTVNLPTLKIADGLNIASDYTMESSPSIGGKYSGIDVWDVNLSAYPELFGIENTVGLGASATRQFTFIQQYNDRASSVMRVPYDPITKVPLKSDLFFKTKFNENTKQQELVIKEGEFIGFRSVLALSLGKGSSLSLNPHIGVDAGLNAVLAGEFDVHIFKMKNNQVRVKIMSIKDKTLGASFGLSIIGFDAIGNFVLSRVIDFNLLQLQYSRTDSDLFIADYIFNLDSKESREMYDQLIGHKMKTFDINSLKDQIKRQNPFAKNSTSLQHIIGDLDLLNQISKQDENQPVNDRRIIRVSTGKNETSSDTFGIKFNIAKIIKARSQKTQSLSKVTLYAEENHSLKNKYILEKMSNEISYRSFWLWGETDLVSSSLLLKTDENFQPEKLVGFQHARTKEDMSMTSGEFADVKQSFMEILPPSVSAQIQWPNWNFGAKDSVQNVFVEQELLFTENLFTADLNLTLPQIKNELLKIIKHFGKFRSEPMSVDHDKETNPRYKAFVAQKYSEAYTADWEQYVIPIKLAEVFQSGRTATERYAAYQYLTSQVPLFREIGNLIILRLIPQDKLADIIVAKLALSARDQKATMAYYPSKDIYNKSNPFREITGQTDYILNRSYNLRNYIKEDGSTYSAQEVLSFRTNK